MTLTDDARADAAEGGHETDPQAGRWAAAHGRGPGVYLDQHPPADPAATAAAVLARTRAATSLTVLQANATCDRLALDVGLSARLSVATYPVRNGTTCANLAEATRAQEAGLSPTAAVCPGCRFNTSFLRANGLTEREVALFENLGDPFSVGAATDGDDVTALSPVSAEEIAPTLTGDEATTGGANTPDRLVPQCPYLEALETARAAPHRIATSARARIDLANLAGEAEMVLLIEGAEDTLAPHATTPGLRQERLDALSRALAGAAREARRKGGSDDWWCALDRVVATISAALRAGHAGVVALPPPITPPRGWQASLWGVLSDGRVGRLPPHLVTICAAAASGRLASLLLHPGDGIQGTHAGGGIRPADHLSAVWVPCVPDATVIAVGDAPANLPAVIDITAAGPPGWVARAAQIPLRVTAGKRPAPLAALIRGHLARHPAERLGVLLPGAKRRYAATRDAVLEQLRVAERACVEIASWHAGGVPACDRLLCLGVPALPPRSVRRRLARAGNAAAGTPGDWGDVTWTGTGADGTPRQVAGRCYRQPAWAAAYCDCVTDVMRRKFAGVRVPLTIVSDMGLCLPLVDGPMPLTAEHLCLLETLAANNDTEMAHRPDLLGEYRREDISTLANLADAPPGVVNPIVAKATSCARLAKATGLSPRTARRLLGEIEQAGLATRVGTRGGWRPGPILYPPPAVGVAASPALVSLPDGPNTTAGAEEGVAGVAREGEDPRDVVMLALIRLFYSSATGVVTAEWVAEVTGLPPRAVQRHLRQLADEGQVEKIKARGRGAGWTLPATPLQRAKALLHEALGQTAQVGPD